MDLSFDTTLVQGYNSPSQIIAKILTEDWLFRNMYCPICGASSIQKAKPNAPVKDYICEKCLSQYELKSKRDSSNKYKTKVNDGVYRTMIDRITSLDNPHFFFMHYDNNAVNNLIIIPKYYFVPHFIEKRKPLKEQAKRSGWEGCNILLNQIPETAKIFIIRNSKIIDKQVVLDEYQRVCSLKNNNINNRGWLFDVLKCVEKMDKIFTLQQMYSFIPNLKKVYIHNHNIEAKIRQQLQFLRDKGFIEFLGNGVYKKFL